MKNKNKRGRKFDIAKQYKLGWKFLKESKNYFYFSGLFFILFTFLGYFVPTPVGIEDYLMKMIQDLLEKTIGMGQFELIKFIFLNNVFVSFMGIILGGLVGFFPFIYIIFNGYVLGFASKIAVNKGGFFILLDLLPHGVFELPAILISFALGLKVGSFILKKNKGETFADYLKNSMRIFLLVVIPLLAIAAVIEGTLIIYS